MPSSASPSSVAKVPPARRYLDQIGPLRRSSSRHANTPSSALWQAIVTGIEPRLSAISIVTRARITSIELAIAAHLLVSRFFALASILTRHSRAKNFYKKKIFETEPLSDGPASMARPEPFRPHTGGRVTLLFARTGLVCRGPRPPPGRPVGKPHRGPRARILLADPCYAAKGRAQ